MNRMLLHEKSSLLIFVRRNLFDYVRDTYKIEINIIQNRIESIVNLKYKDKIIISYFTCGQKMYLDKYMQKDNLIVDRIAWSR